jgi:hypothetical protein
MPKMKSFTLVLTVLLLAVQGFAQEKIKEPKRVTISGHIIEKDSKENLIGAVVFIPSLNISTQSNNYGFYSLTLPVDSNFTIIVSLVGYAPKVGDINTSSNQEINFVMEPSRVLKEVVVNEKKINLVKDTRMSMIDIPIQDIKNIPTILGEKDVIKSIQLLPGVQKGTEGSTGFYVRGGGPDQNLIILDDATVYNSNHFFGFFSTFNGDAIKNVQLIKGGFPARYGGRLSSVLEMSMKDGSRDSIQGEIGVGLIASKLVLEGPIKKGKSSFIIAARRTYVDLLALPIIKSVDPNAAAGYYFYDFNAKYNDQLSKKDRIYVSAYLGRDKFYANYNSPLYSDKVGLFWGNRTGTFRYNHQFNQKVFSNLSLIASDFVLDLDMSTEDKVEDYSNQNKFFSGIRDFSVKYDVDYVPLTRHQIKTGFIATQHKFTPLAYSIINADYIGQKEERTIGINSIEGAAYIEDDWKVFRNLNILAGVRYSMFRPQKNPRIYNNIEPRFSTRYLFKNNSSLKASYAEMNQYIHLLSNSTPGLPTDLWVPATSRIRPQHSKQWAFGYNKEITSIGLEMSIEAYYKKTKNNITYKEGASFLVEDVFNLDFYDTLNYEDRIVSGTGYSTGIELFMRYTQERFNGWIGYTISRTRQTYAEINFGKEFAPKYDRLHDLSIVGSYKISEKTRLSGSFVFSSGNALTVPVGEYTTTPDESGYTRTVEYYGERGNFRAEPYHRLDIGLQKIKKKKHGTRTWEYGLYNAYSRANPFFYAIERSDFDDDLLNSGFSNDKGLALYRISLFPVIPYISYSYKF